MALKSRTLKFWSSWVEYVIFFLGNIIIQRYPVYVTYNPCYGWTIMAFLYIKISSCVKFFIKPQMHMSLLLCAYRCYSRYSVLNLFLTFPPNCGSDYLVWYYPLIFKHSLKDQLFTSPYSVVVAEAMRQFFQIYLSLL